MIRNFCTAFSTGSEISTDEVLIIGIFNYLEELGWLSIKEMIVKETSTMMYKSLNDLAPQYLSDLFVRLLDSFHFIFKYLYRLQNFSKKITALQIDLCKNRKPKLKRIIT